MRTSTEPFLPHAPPRAALGGLAARYARIRERTAQLLAGLETEDLVAQSMPDASPAKWHLAHTTWFFEAFVLQPAGFEPLHPAWLPLLNSYYEAHGPRHPRAERGLLTRPTLAQVLDYRHAIDERIHALLERHDPGVASATIELGLQHEQQHQELIVTDVKHLLFRNPLAPAWRTRRARVATGRIQAELVFHEHEEGRTMIGAAADGFAYDHERPRHTTWLAPYALAARPVTNAEYAAFVDAGGYREPALWLADGWARLESERMQAPLY
ncbi:MAG TPA: DinB family protein, partial [Candidatus Saccharimonadia bacterium]|nr:DinB family protein [Candidatus Saccharimonadia bacterium]